MVSLVYSRFHCLYLHLTSEMNTSLSLNSLPFEYTKCKHFKDLPYKEVKVLHYTADRF